MIEEISRLKKERNAVILAHNYQPGPIQDIADRTGDSLELSRAAAEIDCDVLIFAGVDFMAETASILSPEKTVLLPGPGASCPMAHMLDVEGIRKMREEHPAAAVVCYVNSTAEVKAASDICCTSANAVKVVASLEEGEVIFVPDRNLASYASRFTDKKIIPGTGYCYIHDRFTADQVAVARKIHPGAEVLVHPECRPDVVDASDHVFSTSGMSRHAGESAKREFIIGTEAGMVYRLEKDNPGKKFYPLCETSICLDMNKTGLDDILRSLQTLQPRITVPGEIASKARRSIERMLAV